MKSYVMWRSMIAGMALVATPLLSTSAMTAHVLTEDAFAVPALSFVHFSANQRPSGSMPHFTAVSLSGAVESASPTHASLLSSPSVDLLGDAAMRKRSRRDRSAQEEALMGQYMGYAIIITGGALVVVGGLGLVASTKAPAGMSGTVTLLGLGAIAGGGLLIYWGYQYNQEADQLAGPSPPTPLMVGYAGTF